MNHVDAFNRAQSNHDNQLPPSDGREPSSDQIDTAFDELVADNNVMADFLDDRAPDTTTVFQLYHQYGLPSMDCSEKDDNLRDSYENTLTSFLDEYRAWLESPHGVLGSTRLKDRADVVMQREMEQAREDAESEAEDDRFLNGGW